MCPLPIEKARFPHPRPAGRSRAIATLLVALSIAAALVLRPGAAGASPSPELLALLERMQHRFDRSDFATILDDPRYASNRTEAARLSVVSQILGYAELNAVAPSPDLRDHIRARADFLVRHFDTVRSGTAFDGMLALALLRSWQATGDSTYWIKGRALVAQLRQLTGFKATLNWGLMTAMALEQYAELATTGPRARARSRSSARPGPTSMPTGVSRTTVPTRRTSTTPPSWRSS